MTVLALVAVGALCLGIGLVLGTYLAVREAEARAHDLHRRYGRES
jgi:uncharacterized protein YneF (UPF0154 family)